MGLPKTRIARTKFGAFEQPYITQPVRILVDADNLRPSSAFAVARNHGLHVMAIHNESHTLRRWINHLERCEPNEGAPLIEDVVLPATDQSVDRVILGIVGRNDIVMTDDIRLTQTCLKLGASVVDGQGARFSSRDSRTFTTLSELRKERDRQRAEIR